MAISGVNSNVNQNYVQVQQERKGGVGKAIASTFLPGLGQFCDGRNKDGAKYLGGVLATGIPCVGLSVLGSNSILNAFEKGGAKIGTGGKASLIGTGILGLATLGIWVAGIVDAYKGGNQAKEVENPDTKQPIYA